MRTNVQILADLRKSIKSINKDRSEKRLLLEVLIDIRDIFQDMVASLWRIEDKMNK